jgi:hypothetical protein
MAEPGDLHDGFLSLLSMIPKKPAPAKAGVDTGFPPARSLGMAFPFWLDASAGEGRSEKIMLHQLG